MSYINDMYVFVEDEGVNRSVTASEHPVEQGVDITDHIKPDATELSLKGKIVGESASNTLSRLTKLMQDGNPVNYVGRNIFKNVVISSISTSHPYTVWGGCDFEMTLKEIRVADPSYRTEARLNSGVKQIDYADKSRSNANTGIRVYHTTKKGDTVYALVVANTAPYKRYGFTADDVMEKNPSAFSRKGDFGTLRIGVRLWVGNR